MTVHNAPDKKLVDYLRQLDLSTDEITAYLALLQHGPHTVLQLSRRLATGRTKLYPLLETLAAKRLVTVHERHYGTSYEAATPETLGFLVDEQERLSQTLRSGLPAALHSLKELHRLSPTTSALTEYHGTDGLKQMYWNQHRAETDYYRLALPAASKLIGAHLAAKLQSAHTQRSVAGRVLTNQKKPALPSRYLNPAIFKIEFETYAYDHVVALGAFDKNTFHGIEVHNRHLARQYKQLLHVLYRQAN